MALGYLEELILPYSMCAWRASNLIGSKRERQREACGMLSGEQLGQGGGVERTRKWLEAFLLLALALGCAGVSAQTPSGGSAAPQTTAAPAPSQTEASAPPEQADVD